jgi:hypothetical protein
MAATICGWAGGIFIFEVINGLMQEGGGGRGVRVSSNQSLLMVHHTQPLKSCQIKSSFPTMLINRRDCQSKHLLEYRKSPNFKLLVLNCLKVSKAEKCNCYAWTLDSIYIIQYSTVHYSMALHIYTVNCQILFSAYSLLLLTPSS